MRRAAKRDSTEPAIIDALEKVGWHVWPLSQEGLPDLAVRHPNWPPGLVKFLEVKSAKGGIRKEQEAQRNFIDTTGTPIVRSPREALEAMGEVIVSG